RAFFASDSATTVLYTLSLHDALPISEAAHPYDIVAVHHVSPRVLVGLVDQHASDAAFGNGHRQHRMDCVILGIIALLLVGEFERSEEHTSELQSRFDLVCRLLLEKKK